MHTSAMLGIGRVIHLQCTLGEDDKEVVAAIEILLDGLRDDEALKIVDDVVGAKGIFSVEYLDIVDSSLVGGLGGQMKVVVGERKLMEILLLK